MIPIIINNDIPLPIPLSVILSPNHIANTVPVVNNNIDENQKVRPLPNKNALSGIPKLGKLAI